MGLDFVGMDPDSPRNKCPAVYVDPETGDGLFVGKIVDDPLTIAEMASHGAISADEGVFRMPAQMWPIIAEAAAGTYGKERQGPGPVAFEGLIAATKRSVARLEMRESYDCTDPAYQRWKEGARGDDVMVSEAEEWRELVGAAVARGVTWRRLRVVPEPLTDYLKWEHHLTGLLNVAAGEEVRWLPRRMASGLLLPGNDMWLFDRRTVQFHHLAPASEGGALIDHGDETTNAPTLVAQTIAAFDTAWEYGIPHAEFKPA